MEKILFGIHLPVMGFDNTNRITIFPFNFQVKEAVPLFVRSVWVA